MTATIRKKSLKTAKAAEEQSLLDTIAGMSAEGKANLKAMMSFQGSKEWEGLKVVPPGSFLEEIIELFRSETDIPLELPLIAVLSQVSGFLNAASVKYEMGGVLHPPRTWTIALAPSGSGKTFAVTTIERWLSDADGARVVPEFANASSAAQFVANFEQVPKGLWVRDEFGQFLSQINNLQYMEEIKDVLLRAFSGSPIERNTKQVKIEVIDHAMSILGITVGDTFEKQIGAESLVDGFAQRFNYIRAERDPARSLQDYPIYFEDMDRPEIQSRYKRIRSGWLHLIGRNDIPEAQFTFDPDAIQLFKDSFRVLFADGAIPGSFYRRAMFSVFSYAVIFHAIAGKMGTCVERDSVALAVRMVELHLNHARKLLNGYGLSELEKTVRKAEAIRDKKIAQGDELAARDLVSGIREIKTAGQAYALIALLKT